MNYYFLIFVFHWNPIAISPTKSYMSKGKRIKTIVFHQEKKKCTKLCKLNDEKYE